MGRYFYHVLWLILISSCISAHGAELMVKLVSITSPVPPGATVTLVVATEPGATCAGYRQNHEGAEKPLRSVIAGSDGRVNWSWQIRSGNKPIGLRTVHVACMRGQRQGSVRTAFDVR